MEHVLHGVAALALVVAAWIAFRTLNERPAVAAEGSQVQEALVRWSMSESPQRAHLSFTAIPSPELRDWVTAIGCADTVITWQGESFTPSGLVVEPIADPTHPARIWVATPPRAEVAIRDSLGLLAKVRAGQEGGGVAVTVPRVAGKVSARVGKSEATGVIRDALKLKPVLILGAAGWEGKFVMAALEEYGWKVDARLRVSPRETVIQGQSAPKIDFEHYSAVIALDGTAARHARAIEQYVRAGGGLIAIGEAASLRAFASLMGAQAGEASEQGEFTHEPGVPPRPARHALSLTSLAALKEDALALEQGPDNAVAAVARRVGDGRVLQVGYHDTWRWRMAGNDTDPVGAHRKWWSAMVSSVAHADRTAHPAAEVVEPTPLASLIATLGPATTARTQPALATFLDPRMLKGLFAIALAALLLEWASRRLRGSP